MEIKNIVVKLSVLVTFFSLIVLSGIFAWTDAPGNPPNPNADPPLNIGSITQIKKGGLILNTDGIYENGLSVIGDFVAAGDIYLTDDGIKTNANMILGSTGDIDTAGTMSIGGDIIPLVDVTSDLGSASNAWDEIYFNKGYFSILDPIYQIEGKKYATYVSDMTGLKAETAGELEFRGNEMIINLSKQEKESDLWLFYNIVKKDTIIPFVSSQSPVGLYGYIDGENFVIKTISEYSGIVKVSYRLIGERIDNTAMSNVSEDQNISTFINVDGIR